MPKKHKSPPTAPYNVPDKGRTTITDTQIAQAAYDAGFRGNGLTTAIAIALAESHGNTTALNDHGEFSVGLWQINVNGYLSSRLKRWGLDSWIDLWDPLNNAKAAYALSGGGHRFGLWSTYKHGSYLKYMDRASAAAKTVNNPTPNSTTTGGTTSFTPPAQVQRSNVLPPAIISVNQSSGVVPVVIAIAGLIMVAVYLARRSNGNSE